MENSYMVFASLNIFVAHGGHRGELQSLKARKELNGLVEQSIPEASLGRGIVDQAQ